MPPDRLGVFYPVLTYRSEFAVITYDNLYNKWKYRSLVANNKVAVTWTALCSSKCRLHRAEWKSPIPFSLSLLGKGKTSTSPLFQWIPSRSAPVAFCLRDTRVDGVSFNFKSTRKVPYHICQRNFSKWWRLGMAVTQSQSGKSGRPPPALKKAIPPATIVP